MVSGRNMILRPEKPSPNKKFYKETLRDIEEFEKKHPEQIIPTHEVEQ